MQHLSFHLGTCSNIILYVHLDPEHGAGRDGAGLVGGGAHVVALVPRVDAVETHAPVTDNLDPVRKTVPALATPANLWNWITSDLKHETSLTRIRVELK